MELDERMRLDTQTLNHLSPRGLVGFVIFQMFDCRVFFSQAQYGKRTGQDIQAFLNDNISATIFSRMLEALGLTMEGNNKKKQEMQKLKILSFSRNLN